MDIEIEDAVFPIVGFIVMLLAFYFGIIYGSIELPLLISLVIMIFLIGGYSYIYKRKNRDMNILKIRFLILLPASVVVLYSIYLQSIDYNFSKNELLTMDVLVLIFLLLSMIGEFVYRRKRK